MSMPARIFATDEMHRWYPSSIWGDTEYIRADLVAEKDARIAFLEKALEQAIEVTALRYLPPKEVEGSDGRATELPAGIACSHRHERGGWMSYDQSVILSNPELVSELIRRGASDE